MDETEEHRPKYLVTARVSPDFVSWLPYYFGETMVEEAARAGPPDAEGWVTVTLPFESLEGARERILSFGRAVEVLAPVALRCSILDHAAQTVSLYTGE